ncbi:MAG: SpoIVB peptidase [Clostridium sp.]|nr:SpoIVB peptidase [Clostridium sp.]
MRKNIMKKITVFTAPILILTLILGIFLDKTYTSKNVENISVGKDFSKAIVSKECMATSKTSLYKKENLGLLNEKSNIISLNKTKNDNDIYVTPGGDSVGVRLSSNGVLVVGYSKIKSKGEEKESPAKEVGIEIGDLITKVNNKTVKRCSEFISKVKECKNKKITLEIERGNETITKEVVPKKEENNEYKLGIWIRDSTAGVGTLTFFDEETGKFGALGHPVTDGDTNKLFSIEEGDILESSILSVKKGEKGNPGELRGIFLDESNPIGKIEKNTQCGIFGCNKENLKEYNKNSPMKVGFKEEIQLGKASIITTIDESGPKEYEIEIVKLFNQEEPTAKSMVIKVTDPELLEKTGGIVQGMSGSPIIQNNKIIGAVTHVLINKPDVGYGVYIDWMLKDAGILK